MASVRKWVHGVLEPPLGIGLLLTLVLSCCTGRPSFAQQLDSLPSWGVDPSGAVFSVARSGNTLYVGGSFYSVGKISGGAVPLEIATARAPAHFPQVAGRVNAVVPDGTGGWFIGGWFSAVGGRPHANLAHVRVDGVDDSWNAGADNEVTALTRANGALYVGGDFDSLGGAARLHVGAIDAATAELRPWDPRVGDRVTAIQTAHGNVYLGGWFTSVGDSSRLRLACVDSTTGAVTPWNPGADDQVLTLALIDTTLYVGGRFANVGGSLHRYLAAVDVGTGAVRTWNPNVNRTPDFSYDGGPRVSALLVQDTLLYVAGSFKTIGGKYREGLAVVGTTSAIATAWDPRTYSAIVFGAYFSALALSGDTLFVAGQVDSIGGTPGSYLAALRTSDASRVPWDPRPNREVQALCVQAGTLFAGGRFNSIGDWMPRSCLAAFDVITGQLKPWAPEADDYVATLCVRGGRVYVGGAFSSVGGQPRGGVAALDTVTGAATPWNPGANGGVFAIAPWRDRVFLGGGFNRIGGVVRQGVAAVDTAMGAATPWNPTANDIVYAIAPAESVVYLGGWFSAIGGMTRQTLAAVDTSAGAPTPWAPSTDVLVESIALSGGQVYVGGPFNTVNGVARSALAALTPQGELSGWAPAASATVHALVAIDSTIYVGGEFQTIGGESRSSLAALDGRTGQVRPWNPGADGAVLGLATDGLHVDVAGTFGRMGNWAHSGIASFSLEPVSVPKIPGRLFLAQNAPNPSISTTLIRYALPTAASVSLVVYDPQGRRMASPISHALQAAGPHQISVPTSGWNPGCYFYELEAAGVRTAKKMIVLR